MINSTKQITEVSTPPTIWAKPVPTRLRTPSTSVITRETSSPVLALSKKRIGNRIIWAWTCAHNLDIKFWASTLRICVNANEVTDWITTASTTARISHFSNSKSLEGITSSTRYLLAPGKTKPANRLITISKSPINNCFLLGQIMVLKTLAMVTFSLVVLFAIRLSIKKNYLRIEYQIRSSVKNIMTFKIVQLSIGCST